MNRSTERVEAWVAWSAVAWAGFLALAVELSLSRLLRPWFGDMLFLWAAIIGFVLLYLALGNYLGGRLAQRGELTGVPVILGVAGLAIYGIPWITHPLLAAAQRSMHAYHLTLPLVALLVTFLLLALPLTLLGMISPLVIGYWTRRGRDGGDIAGRVLALSTLGSLVGSFLPVFWMLPLWGTRRTFALLGAGALLWGGITGVALLGRRGLPLLLLLLPLLLSPPSALSGPIKPFDPTGRGRVVYETESQYNYIQVVEWKGERWLRLNEGEGIHSVWRPHMTLSDGIWDYFLLAPAFRGGRLPRRLLVIGLAGGTIPTLYAHAFPAVETVGVELDPAVIDVAYRFFHLGDIPHLRAVAGDGRVYARQTDARFDVIVLDAYRPPYIPFHLTTVEFFRLLRGRLRPHGIVMVNAARTARDTRLVHALSSTMRRVFPRVYIVDEPLNGALWGNSVVVGLQDAVAQEDILREMDRCAVPQVRLVGQRAKDHLRPAPPPTLILTDDRAPIEQIVHGIIWSSLVGREDPLRGPGKRGPAR